MGFAGGVLRGIGRALGFGQGAQGTAQPGGIDPRQEPWADALVKMVNDEFTRRQRDRLPEELGWRLNIAFLLRQQFLHVNPVSNTLDETPLLYDHEERVVFDQLGPTYEARVARLRRGYIVRKVRPASKRQRDIHGAQVGGSLLTYDEQENHHREQVGEIFAWTEALGTAYKKRLWDPQRGAVIAMVQDSPDGEPVPVKEGDQATEVVSPFELYPENLFAPWRKQRSLIHARAMHVDDIRDTWGVDVQAEQVEAMSLQATSRGLGGFESREAGYRIGVSRLEKHAVVKEYYERPSKRFPGGRLIIVVRDRLLHYGALPYRCGDGGAPDFPFTPYYSVWRPNRFFGDCWMSRAVPLQRHYNALRNRRIEYLKRAAIGEPVIQENSVVNLEDIETNSPGPGQIWEYRQGAQPPQYMDYPQLPAAFETEIALCEREFQVMGGVSDFGRLSEAPSGVKSGIALKLVMEQDETRLALPASNYLDGEVEDGRKCLRLYRQFGEGPRIARIANRSEAEVLEWTATDITSDDVIVDGTPNLAESPSARRQWVMDLLASGLLNDPDTGRLTREGRAKALEMIEMGHWEGGTETDYELQRAAAQRAIAAIRQGRLPPTLPYHDHAVHVQEVVRWMLTAEYEEMAAANDAVLLAANTYLQEQQAALQQQIMAQAAMEAQQQAMAGPQKGGPPARGNQQQEVLQR